MFQEPVVQARWLRRWQIVLPIALVGVVMMTLSMFMHRDQIATLRFSDPDDVMRLLEVRDFLAGQSWFDVSQHRANPPVGGSMHWSRLVDLPIAGIILLLRPLLGAHGAEIGAVLIVPVLTLALLLFALYKAICPLLGQGRTLLACIAFAISPFIFVQCGAMRIDHHAWQAVMMAFALGGTLHPNARKGGVVAGLAMAVWLAISIEGLVYAALTGVVMTVRYALNAKEWPRLSAYVWTTVAASALLVAGTQGWGSAWAPHCDTLSSVYLAPLAVFPPIMSLSHGRMLQTTGFRRLFSVVMAGAVAIAIFLVTGKQCLAGPFDMLDPFVYKFWFLGIYEGLPIWMQNSDTAIIVIFPALIGIAGYVKAASGEDDPLRRLDVLSLLLFALGATVVAVFIMRAGLVAHLIAIPGAAWLAASSFKYARGMKMALFRIPATIVSVLLLFPIVVIPAKSVAFPTAAAKSARITVAPNPAWIDEIAELDLIAPATVFAPIDMSPSILLLTRNTVIGTGHHRNSKIMGLVFRAFLSPPQEARAIVLRSAATYLVVAPIGETDRYREYAPRGLAAQLLDGQCPDWLIPVNLRGVKTLRVYRIYRPNSLTANTVTGEAR